MRYVKIVAITAGITGALLWSSAYADPRTDCPTPAPCKVITLTQEEEKALVGPNMVFDTAVQGRQLDMFGIITYLRQKLAAAPAGDAPRAEPAQKQ